MLYCNLYAPPMKPCKQSCTQSYLIRFNIQHSLFLIDIARQSAAYGTEELLFDNSIIIEKSLYFPGHGAVICSIAEIRSY